MEAAQIIRPPSHQNLIIRPNPGSQTHFTANPWYELLYDGTRGPGKTLALLFSYMQYVGKGFGSDYQGIIFRRKRKELRAMVIEFDTILTKIYGYSLLNKTTLEFKFPTGEILYLAFAQYPRDYQNFHGHNFAFIGFDELTNWATSEVYHHTKSILRCKNPLIPLRVRATTNSLGPGHSWVKDYFRIMETKSGTKIDNKGLIRGRLFGSIRENPYLMHDKNYLRYLLTHPDENVIKSWVLGRWDVVAGGALSDVWRTDHHIIEPFKIPRSWKIYRNIDWGSAKPYSVFMESSFRWDFLLY